MQFRSLCPLQVANAKCKWRVCYIKEVNYLLHFSTISLHGASDARDEQHSPAPSDWNFYIMTKFLGFAVLTTLAALSMVSVAHSAILLDFTITGNNVGGGISWQSESTISTLENKYTAGQGDWMFSTLITTSSQEMANLLTEKQSFDKGPYAGTGFGILVGKNGSHGTGGSYIVFEDTGKPIFTYTGGVSANDGRPFDATFKIGTYTLETSTGMDTLVVSSAVPEPSTLVLMVLGFGGLGAVSYRRAKMVHAA
jgi:hypothetical protein